jgi:uncharacterized membrane protein YadS
MSDIAAVNNSVSPITERARGAAMGIKTDFRKLKADGLKPLLLAAAARIFISVFALVLVKLFIS